MKKALLFIIVCSLLLTACSNKKDIEKPDSLKEPASPRSSSRISPSSSSNSNTNTSTDNYTSNEIEDTSVFLSEEAILLNEGFFYGEGTVLYNTTNNQYIVYKGTRAVSSVNSTYYVLQRPLPHYSNDNPKTSKDNVYTNGEFSIRLTPDLRFEVSSGNNMATVEIVSSYTLNLMEQANFVADVRSEGNSVVWDLVTQCFLGYHENRDAKIWYLYSDENKWVIDNAFLPYDLSETQYSLEDSTPNVWDKWAYSKTSLFDYSLFDDYGLPDSAEHVVQISRNIFVVVFKEKVEGTATNVAFYDSYNLVMHLDYLPSLEDNRISEEVTSKDYEWPPKGAQ